MISIFARLKKTDEMRKQRTSRVMRAMENLISQQYCSGVERDRDLEWEFDHMNRAVKYAKILATCRKLDSELAASAVAMQNIGRIVSGRSRDHAESGFEPARRLLVSLACFNPAEVIQIANSVRRHSRKDKSDSPLDELAKDVDIYVRYLQGHDITKAYETARLRRIMHEIQRHS